MRPNTALKPSFGRLAIGLLFLATCNPQSNPQGASGGSATSADDIEQQLRRYDSQLDKGDEQIARVQEQSKRYDGILAKWEEQAGRLDRMLDRWEKVLERLETSSMKENDDKR